MATPGSLEIQGDVGGSHRKSSKKKFSDSIIDEVEKAAIE